MTRALTAGLSLCALLACAPPSSMPPPVPLAGDIGVGVNASGGLGYHAPPSGDGGTGPIIDLQGYAYSRLGQLEFGAVAYTGLSSQLGGGLFGRRVMQRGGLTLAPQLELGAAWAGAALPLAWSPKPQLWLTTQPGLRVLANPPETVLPQVSVPLGVAVQRGEHLTLTAELGLRWAITGAPCPDGATLSPYGQQCMFSDGTTEDAEARQTTAWLALGGIFSPSWRWP